MEFWVSLEADIGVGNEASLNVNAVMYFWFGVDLGAMGMMRSKNKLSLIHSS